MGKLQVVPALATAEAEEFLGGSDALADPGAVPGTQAAARAGRSFEIVPGPEDCWLLYLYEDGREAGAGQFPEDSYCDALEAGEEFCAAADPQPETLEPVETEAGAGPIPVWYRKESGYACCVGIDMPEVGHVHAADCPAMRRNRPCGTDIEIPPVRSGAESVVGEVPWRGLADGAAAEPSEIARSRRELQDVCLSQLIFAARDLAQTRLIPHVEFADGYQPGWCLECQMTEHLGRIVHGVTCRAGRVLGLIAELCATLPSFDPTRKETATDGERGCAGDGIRPLQSADALQMGGAR